MAFTIVADAALISGDASVTKPAAVFKGGDTNDYYQINALAVARTTANDTVGTIMAWINTTDKTSTGTIIGFGDDNAVEFIDFQVVAGKLGASCTDAATAQFVSATDAAVITPHVWTHVAVVQAADGAGPKFYVNGVKVASTNSTSTDVNEWFNNCDGIDTGRIGASNKAGDASVTNEFVGAITGLKYYATALTAEQIMQDMYGVTTASAIANFQFDGDLVNSGSEGTAAVAVSDVYITPTYNEFISRVRAFITQGTVVVADVGGFAHSDGTMSALFINAA